MEKKVPERKVSLREEDIFYVYDKRINKCIKEDCEGTVKYGLVLRVGMSGEETCNCFECNKCHMKYTPYPNYVRLTKTDMMEIYNKEEVDARDRKRAEDALKQAAREKRKQQGQGKFAPRRDNERGSERRPYERKSYETRSYDKKSYDRKPYEKKSYDRKSYEKKPYGNSSYGSGSYERKTYERKSYGERTYERKSYDSEGYEKKPYEKKPYGERTYEKKPYDSRRSGYRSYNRSNTEGNYGERKNNGIVISNGNYRKPYSNKQS